MKKTVLRVENLSKSFSAKAKSLPVLDSISLHLKEKEIISIIGPSGCGKSTLLDCIAGLTVPDKGTIHLNGNSMINAVGTVGYMTQDVGMFPWRTVLKNVMLPLEIQGIKKQKAQKQTLALLEQFNLGQFADYYPDMLSGGMLQRISLLRTYLCDTNVLLFDEPFGKLDALTKIQVQQWLLAMWQTNKKSIIFVTHDIDEAILISDRIYIFSSCPCHVVAEIPITAVRPRRDLFITTTQFITIKKKIMKHMGL